VSGVFSENDRGQFVPVEVEAIQQVILDHYITYGVMASPNHWAHHHPEGEWFAHCGEGWDDRKGCGWESKPHCYSTKEEAKAAAAQHLAEKIKEALS
jgi:hypothetical protein